MEKTFLEITHARIYARGGEGGLDLLRKFQIYRIHLVKFLKIAPFPFGNKVIVPTHTSIPPPRGKFSGSVHVSDFIYIRWHQFSWIL